MIGHVCTYICTSSNVLLHNGCVGCQLVCPNRWRASYRLHGAVCLVDDVTHTTWWGFWR
jgi:hypothetical protein